MFVKGPGIIKGGLWKGLQKTVMTIAVSIPLAMIIVHKITVSQETNVANITTLFFSCVGFRSIHES